MKKTSSGKTLASSGDEIGKLIKIVLVVVALFIVFYVITLFVTKKEEKTTPKATTIQYSEIVLGNMLSQNEDEYYVLVYREEDPYLTLYNAYLTIYKSKDDALKSYTVNLDDGFNQGFIGEKNIDRKDLSKLRLTDTALFHIKNKKIVDVYDNREDMIKIFDKLTEKKEDK